LNIHFITTLASRPVSWKWSLSLRFPLYEPPLSPRWHMLVLAQNDEKLGSARIPVICSGSLASMWGDKRLCYLSYYFVHPLTFNKRYFTARSVLSPG
jgi:hypothetical protein